MVGKALICCVVLSFLACVNASAQRVTQRRPPARQAPARQAPARRTPPPPTPPARDAAPPSQAKAAESDKAAKPLRPEGSKPISLETAQKEAARLKEAIAKYEQRLAEGKAKGNDAAEPTAKKAGTTAKAAATEKPTATDEPAAPAEAPAKKAPAKADTAAGPADAAPRKKPTLATVEAENKALRRQLDKLLLKVAALEGTLPAKAPGQPAFDPHIIDRPNNADFHPGKTLDQLEYGALCAGRPIGEVGDEVVYEWVFHFTDEKRTQHSTHQIWVQAKDGVATNLMEGAPGVMKAGPPPRTTF